MKREIKILGIFMLLLTNLISHAQDKPVSYYDIVGQSHNKGLDKFFSDYSSARIKRENIKIDGLNSYLSNQSIFSNSNSILTTLSHPIYINNRKTALADLPSSLLKQGLISELCGSYISAINKIIDNDFEGNNLSSNIISLENQIFQDLKLSSVEKEILLSTTSIAKSSSNYWLEKLPTLSTNWANGNETAFNYGKYNEDETGIIQGGNMIDYFNLNKIENYDDKTMRNSFYGCGRRIVKGDIAGAASGAVVGAVLGGAGAIPGAFAGALGGSVYESVMCILDWLF